MAEFHLIDVANLKSEHLDEEYLLEWKGEIERRMDWINQVGQLLTPLVVYADGFDGDGNQLFEVEDSEHNYANFLAMYQLRQQQPRRFEMASAWVVDREDAETYMQCIDE